MVGASAGKKRAELKRLSSDVQRNIFEMLRLAHEILSDHEYVATFGNEAKCIDDMQEREFSHFGGNPTLGMMLRAYRMFPDIAEWRKNKFNIRVMIDLANPRETKEGERVNWKARCAELEAEVANYKARVEEQAATIAALRSTVDSLTKEVHTSQGRILELERARRAA